MKFTNNACTPEQTHLFFSSDNLELQTAKEICRGCPVKEDCLRQALVENVECGVYGGEDLTSLRKPSRKSQLKELRARHGLKSVREELDDARRFKKAMGQDAAEPTYYKQVILGSAAMQFVDQDIERKPIIGDIYS